MAIARKPLALLSVTGLIALVGGCADEGRGIQSGASPSPTKATEATTPPAALGCDNLPLSTEAYMGSPESPVLSASGGKVSAQANIFGAGFGAPPAPGGGGGGLLPPVFDLPSGTSRVVTFPSVTGRVTHFVAEGQWNGPEGDGIGKIDVKSLRGIAGIFHRTNKSFLVGLFLTDADPLSGAPPRLDFSETELTKPDTTFVGPFDRLAPEIGQVFLIGDGKGKTYDVPDEATRLFLGFADAMLWEGCPGWYGNNRGKVNVTIEVKAG
ncbi:MAG TPA: hypothetical protein VFH75_02960 [Actinomycetota bacterium]|nr:hypothetical protein [Actinomycetota bacterium]